MVSVRYTRASRSQVVYGTLDTVASPVENMGINHPGFHILMAEKLSGPAVIVALSSRRVATYAMTSISAPVVTNGDGIQN
jgi:hypothetical protein